jgi:hypothetical protein
MNPAKKHNAITNALAAVYGQMFPGGKQEERILTTELYQLLGGRIQKKIVNQAYVAHCRQFSCLAQNAKSKF